MKGFKAKGKRAGVNISSIKFGEPIVKDIPEEVEFDEAIYDSPDIVNEDFMADEIEGNIDAKEDLYEEQTSSDERVIEIDLDEDLTLF